jgi:hypothetical protein
MLDRADKHVDHGLEAFVDLLGLHGLGSPYQDLEPGRTPVELPHKRLNFVLGIPFHFKDNHSMKLI